LDPPYTVAHGNNGFIKYNAKIFSWKDQLRLAAVARQLAGRGCTVLVSNADHSSIRELYQRFETKRLERNSVIAASEDFRSVVTECLFYMSGK
jgi:DNA adenine methylase